MSSLQKFHRRTNNAGAVSVYPTVTIGSGDSIKGFCLGATTDGTVQYNLYAAPLSVDITGTSSIWGSWNILRGTTSVTNGFANTNTLYALGSAAHPAAYYCRTLTTGGYNTWYIPAKNELMTAFSNKSATPFSTADAFIGDAYWTSTEVDAGTMWRLSFNGANTTGTWNTTNDDKRDTNRRLRPFRRSI
jgi:hypothetical protein